jgi:tagaturonate reductase
MKVIQFGEGNFLRAFVDLYLDTLNKENLGNFEISIIKPIANATLEKFHKQNCIYHVILRGRENNKDVENVYKVTSVKEALNPFIDNTRYYELATDPEIKILVSNTTEAGIVYDENDKFDACPNITFPAKVTKWLYKRYKAGLNGIYLLPVELIENNATELFNIVNKYITLWDLGEDFREWNAKENFYCNTLVDRIVSGYPRDEETKSHLTNLIKEEDLLMSVGEPFGLWVIEDKGDIKNILKDGHYNIDVIFTNDISYYKKRKVRVLNGSHTNLVPISLWMGAVTVYDVMKHPKLSKFVDNSLTYDINPFVSSDLALTKKFAEETKERFLNPYLNHQLTSIALNSVSKWKARVLPSFKDYYLVNSSLPKYLTIGLAYLINMYQNITKVDDKYICHLPSRDIEVKDDIQYLEYFFNGNTVSNFLKYEAIWGEDLTKFNNLENEINELLSRIKKGEDLI